MRLSITPNPSAASLMVSSFWVTNVVSRTLNCSKDSTLMNHKYPNSDVMILSAIFRKTCFFFAEPLVISIATTAGIMSRVPLAIEFIGNDWLDITSEAFVAIVPETVALNMFPAQRNKKTMALFDFQ